MGRWGEDQGAEVKGTGKFILRSIEVISVTFFFTNVTNLCCSLKAGKLIMKEKLSNPSSCHGVQPLPFPADLASQCLLFLASNANPDAGDTFVMPMWE